MKSLQLEGKNNCHKDITFQIYYDLFKIEDNSIKTLREDLNAVTYLFSGYDGKIILSGSQKLPWHGISIKESKLQVLPQFIHKIPANYNLVESFIYYYYLLLSSPSNFYNRVKKYIKYYYEKQ